MACICQCIIYRSSVALNSLAHVMDQNRFDLGLKRLGLIAYDRRRCVRNPDNPASSAGGDLLRRMTPAVCGQYLNLYHVRGTRRRRSR